MLVLVPGFGIEVNGAKRWLGAGPVQVQPSEIAKLALVLYAASLIAADPERTRSLYGVRPLLLVGAAMAALVVIEPDLGTAIVIALTLGAMLVVGRNEAAPPRDAWRAALALLALAVRRWSEPYRRERLTTLPGPLGATAAARASSPCRR